MRVIDANTGAELREGQLLHNVNGLFRVDKLVVRRWLPFFSYARLTWLEPGKVRDFDTGREYSAELPFALPRTITTRLIVRTDHPHFSEPVAFLPS